MYGNLVLLEETRKPQHGQRIYVGDEAGTDEAWLRDLLLTIRTSFQSMRLMGCMVL